MNSRFAIASIFIGLAAFATVSFAQTQAQCTFSTFAPPAGYAFTSITGIDSQNTVVGQLENTNTLQTFAFTRSSDGTFTAYAAPNSYTTTWSKRNDNGVNVGWFQSKADAFIHGLFQQNGKVTVENYPGAQSTWLNALNDSTTVVGRYLSSGTLTGFVYQNGKTTLLQFPGALTTTPYGVSDTSIIVGTENDAFSYHGFVLENGQYKQLDHPQGTLGTILEDVNSAGVIVGNYETGDDYFYAFIYKNGQFENVVYPGARAEVGAINDNGIIAGHLYSNGPGPGYTAQCQ